MTQTFFDQTYFLTAGDCNPQCRLPLTLLLTQLIETASLHANQVGIGYDYLAPRNETWVLSRVAIDMTRYPGVNERYTIRTWMVGVNRLFSERDFEIIDSEGTTIGRARTIWAVLNTLTRRPADLSHIYHISQFFPSPLPPRAEPMERPAPLTDFEVVPYRFTYCDLDFNRHVNSSRYIELLLNSRSLDFHDHYRLTRFEISYLHEARYDDQVELRLSSVDDPNTGALTTRAELVLDTTPLLRALLRFTPR